MEESVETRKCEGLSATDTIHLWLDEYFLFRKWNAIKENVTNSKLDKLLEAYLSQRTLVHNEYSVLTGWLNMISNPLQFVNCEGSPPILKCALDRTPSVSKIVSAYSKQTHSPELVVAFEEVKKNLELSMLAVCCHGNHFRVGLDLHERFWRESTSSAEIPPDLMTCLKNKIDFDPSKVLEDLKASVQTFMEGLYKHMPKPAMLAMAEALITKGKMELEEDFGDDDDDNDVNEDFDVPLFKMSCFPKKVQEDHELKLRQWSRKLANQGAKLKERLKENRIAERLNEIVTDSNSENQNTTPGEDAHHESFQNPSQSPLNINIREKLRNIDRKKDKPARLNEMIATESNSEIQNPSQSPLNINIREKLRSIDRKKGKLEKLNEKIVTESNSEIEDPSPDENDGEDVHHEPFKNPPQSRSNIDIKSKDEVIDRTPGTSSRSVSKSKRKKDAPGKSGAKKRRVIYSKSSDDSDGGSKQQKKGDGEIDCLERLVDDSDSPRRTSTQTDGYEQRTGKAPSPCFSQDPTLTPIKNDRPKKPDVVKRVHKMLFSDRGLDKTLDKSAAESVATPMNQTAILKQLRKGDEKNNEASGKVHKPKKAGNVKSDTIKKDDVVKTSSPRVKHESDDSDFEAMAFNKPRDGEKRVYKRGRRHRWTEEEEKLLMHAVSIHKKGNWRIMQEKFFPNRTNVDLKDKWRNMEMCGDISIYLHG